MYARNGGHKVTGRLASFLPSLPTSIGSRRRVQEENYITTNDNETE